LSWIFGGARSIEAVDVLLVHLRSPFAGTRQAAAEALGQIGDARAVDDLLACLGAKKENQEVRVTAAAALGQIGDARAVDDLLACLGAKKENQEVRVTAAAALGQIGDARAVDDLLACLGAKKENQEVRAAAAAALGQIGDARAVEGLLACLRAKKEDQGVRRASAEALGQIGGKRPIAALRRLLEHKDPEMRGLGLAGLSKTCKDPLDRRLLSMYLDDFDPFLDPKAPITEERIEAASMLGVSQEEVRQRYESLATQFGLKLAWLQMP